MDTRYTLSFGIEEQLKIVLQNTLEVKQRTRPHIAVASCERDSTSQNKMIKNASANASRTIMSDITIYHSHTQIHAIAGRALPDQMIKYKHALMLYKLIQQCLPNDEFVQLNFQANLNQRQQYHNFIRMQNYSV